MPSENNCTICHNVILKKENLIVSKCNHFFHKACLDKYLIKQKLLNNSLICPAENCNARLNYLHPQYYNNSFKSQALSLTIVPFDENFTPQNDKKVEIENYNIQELNLRLTQYGFTGEIEFALPVKKYVTSLFQFLQERKPIQVGIKYEQYLASDQEIKNSFTFTGFIECMEDDTTDQEFFDFSVNNDPNTEDCNKLVSFRSSVRCKIVDPLRYFFSKHSPVKVYTGKTYSDILNALIEELKISSIINITVDNFSDFTAKRDLVVIPNTTANGHLTNLYDFLLYTIEAYNGYLFYDPADGENGSYKIKNQKVIQKSSNNDLNVFDKLLVKSVAVKHKNKYCSGLNVQNTDSSDNPESSSVDSNDTNISKGIFNISHLTSTGYPSLFKKKSDNAENRFKYQSSLTESYIFEFGGMPLYIPVQTNTELKLSSQNWQKLFGDKDLTLNVVEIAISFQLFPAFYQSPDLRRADDNLDDDGFKKLLAPSNGDDDKKNVSPFIAVSVDFHCENNDSKYAYLPAIRKPEYPVTVQGVIFVTDEQSNKYSGKYPYLLFDGSSSDPADDNTENKDDQNNFFSIPDLPEHYIAYQVKVPSFKDDSNNPLIISAAYLPPAFSDQFYFPFYNMLKVIVELYHEHALVIKPVTYTNQECTDKDTQTNMIKLGPEQQAKLSFIQNESEGEILTLSKEEEKQKNSQKITMDDDCITIVFEGDNS